MLTQAQQSRLDRKCLKAALNAIDRFDDLLSESVEGSAAHVVADLIKANLLRSAAEPIQSDPSAALAAVVSRLLSTD